MHENSEQCDFDMGPLPDNAEGGTAVLTPHNESSSSDGTSISSSREHKLSMDSDLHSFNFEPRSIATPAQLSPAESLALGCLRAGKCDSHDFIALSNLLPGEAPARSGKPVGDERSFTTGAYCHGPMVGLRHNCKAFKFSTMLLTACARVAFKDLDFTTVGLFKNIKTTRHRDRNNLRNTLNGVVALSTFKGGGVRLHRPDGSEDLQVNAGPITFDASLEHETLEWLDGPRLVLVVFSVSKISQLDSGAKQYLTEVGFPLPLVVSAQSAASNAPTGHTTSSTTTSSEGLILDVFAGDAVFAKQAQKVGFKVLAFDLNPKRVQFPVQPLDITKSDEMQVLKDVISENRNGLTLVQITLPMLAAFFSSDRGSKEFAASLTEAVVDLSWHAINFSVDVAILHPANSAFWSFDKVSQLVQHLPSLTVQFHQCMHGGPQDRLASWWSTSSWHAALGVRCSRDHAHRSQSHADPTWPALLWTRAVDLLAVATGGSAAPAPLYGPSPTALRPALGKQSKKARPLVSEFARYDAWAVPLDCTALEPLISCYPKGAKVVRRKLVPWGSVRVCVCPEVSMAKLQDTLCNKWSWALCSESPDEPQSQVSPVCGMLEPRNFVETAEIIWLGIPREPDDFLEKAVLAGHPKRLLDSEVDPQVSLLIDNLLESPIRLPGKGLDALQDWSGRREQLADAESEARKSWPEHVAKVLGDKSTILLDELLHKFDFPDTRLVKHMTQGFRLSGWLCNTGVFVPDPRPPTSTLQAQLKTARPRNQATIAKLASQVPDDVSRKAWSETLEEVARGWLFEDPEPALDSVLIARRFGLKQGPKVRVIDDCKACSFNATTGFPEKYRLHGVEFIAAFLLRCMQDPRSQGVKISGRTLDLTWAYKQYALHAIDRDVLRIGVSDTEGGRPRFFGVNALPFGATGSVPRLP